MSIEYEVSLHCHVCLFSERFNGLPICPNSSVLSKAIEETLGDVCGERVDVGSDRKTATCDVVEDANIIAPLHLVERESEIVEYCLRHIRQEALATYAIDAACEGLNRELWRFCKSGCHIKEEGIAVSSSFICLVKNGHSFNGLWNFGEEVFGAPGTVQVNIQYSNFGSVPVHVLNALLDGLGSAAHEYDQSVSIWSTVVHVGSVMSTSDALNSREGLDDVLRAGIKEWLCGCASLEENIWPVTKPPAERGIWVQSVASQVLVQQLSGIDLVDVFDGNLVDFLNLAGCSPPVEKVHEWDSRSQCCNVRN